MKIAAIQMVSTTDVTQNTQHSYDGLERRSQTTRYDGQTLTYDYDIKGCLLYTSDAADE